METQYKLKIMFQVFCTHFKMFFKIKPIAGIYTRAYKYVMLCMYVCMIVSYKNMYVGHQTPYGN